MRRAAATACEKEKEKKKRNGEKMKLIAAVAILLIAMTIVSCVGEPAPVFVPAPQGVTVVEQPDIPAISTIDISAQDTGEKYCGEDRREYTLLKLVKFVVDKLVLSTMNPNIPLATSANEYIADYDAMRARWKDRGCKQPTAEFESYVARNIGTQEDLGQWAERNFTADMSADYVIDIISGFMAGWN